MISAPSGVAAMSGPDRIGARKTATLRERGTMKRTAIMSKPTATATSWAESTAAKEATRAARARQDERTDMLALASCYTDKSDLQNPAKVLTVAEPLLAWLDEATDDTDRQARRSALRRVQANWSGGHQSVPASELIEQATVFYRFIAA